MIINGKEYGFTYTIGARCDYDDWVIQNQENAFSFTHGIMMRAVFMNAAYVRKNGGEKLTYEMLRDLSNSEFENLLDELNKQIEQDSKTTIEAESKKAKSTGR